MLEKSFLFTRLRLVKEKQHSWLWLGKENIIPWGPPHRIVTLYIWPILHRTNLTWRFCNFVAFSEYMYFKGKTESVDSWCWTHWLLNILLTEQRIRRSYWFAYFGKITLSKWKIWCWTSLQKWNQRWLLFQPEFHSEQFLKNTHVLSSAHICGES